MSSTHEDAVLNFDLDFLHPTTNNIPVHALKQRYIGQVKKRIIRVDALHQHCNSLKLALCNKNKELELLKKKLTSTTQEYTQTSFEYKEVLENYSKCEKECQCLKKEIRDFQDKYYEAVNNVEAGRSHVVQLQQLIKQYERKIETLQKNDTSKTYKAIKESLEKELLLWKKTHKKDVADWQIKYDKLLKQLQDTQLTKEKLKEKLLVKGNKLNNEIPSDFISHDEHSDNEDDISDDFISGFGNQDSSQNKVHMPQRYPITKKDDMRMVLDSKTDIVSVDTGCGSSLASSLNSPDFVFSPINGESLELNRGPKLVNTATSPILSIEIKETATSPLPAVKMIDVGTSPIKVKSHEDFGTQTEFVIFNNTPIRPIKLITSISPSNDVTNKNPSSPVQTLETSERDMHQIKDDQGPRTIENIPYVEIQETQETERHYLELNNSNNIGEDRITDNEIEFILNTMRLNQKIITPIPKSPKKTVYEDVRHFTCQDAAIARDQAATAKHEAEIAREDLGKAREENKKIMTTLTSLMKDMFYIKSFLKNRFTITDDALELSDCPLSHELFKNVTTGDLNDLSNPFGSSPLDNSELVKSQSSDFHTAVHSEHNLEADTVEHAKITEDEDRVLSYTILEIEDCTNHNIPSEVENVKSLNTSVEVEIESSAKVSKKRGIKKIKKLTNLGKYRKKCEIRKYKIRGKTPPLRKPHMKPKQLIKKPLIRTVTKSDTAATLNNKDVYAKAVQVMAQLKAKSPNHSKEPVTNTESEQTINAVEKHSDVQYEQNTLLDNKSPESTVVSEKSATNSARSLLSAGSPKSVACLQLMSTSPEVTSSPTNITTPRRSSRSLAPCPTATISKSPTSGNSSHSLSNKSPPLSHTITSPISGIISPTPGLTPQSTTPSSSIATRRSLRYSESANVSSQPTTSIFTDSDITAPYSLIKSLEPCGTSAVPTITAKPTIRSPTSSVNTRSKNKYGRGITDQCTVELLKDLDIDNATIELMARKRKLSNSSDTQCKRVLRSAQGLNSEEYTVPKGDLDDNQEMSLEIPTQETSLWDPKESILCIMIQKYAKVTIGPFTRNVPDTVLKNISDKIETFMIKIKEITCSKDNNTMIELVEELQKYDYKNVVSGLMKYLTNPDRKMELFGKSSSPPAPQMTRYEAVLLYVIRQLRFHWRSIDFVDAILSSIEHILFKLNRTPDFDVVESVSHFYALICRYFGKHSRLKVFMLDAMYCILFKSVPLIKQCLEVYPHIIPLAHMSAAKTSLVTIFVYLLHFYKCEDKFNRVQEIRNILVRKYSYQITEWNEKKILDLVKNSIIELKDIPNEQKMLRIAVIILGKRHGAKWAQNNIIKNLLQIMENENSLPEHVTAFCVSMIGPLMKPYPADMKVHCEIAINKLVNIINTTTSKRIEEAAMISMITMGRHNYQRVNEMLLSKKMQAMSPELEETICDYVRMRPLNNWTKTLSRMSMPI